MKYFKFIFCLLILHYLNFVLKYNYIYLLLNSKHKCHIIADLCHSYNWSSYFWNSTQSKCYKYVTSSLVYSFHILCKLAIIVFSPVNLWISTIYIFQNTNMIMCLYIHSVLLDENEDDCLFKVYVYTNR